MVTWYMDRRAYLALLEKDGAHWSAPSDAIDRPKPIEYYLRNGMLVFGH